MCLVSKRGTPAARQSSSLSDSDSDAYGGSLRSRPRSKKAHRRNPDLGFNLAPSHAEMRFSTRRAVKIGSYQESDAEEDNGESEMTTPNYWAGGGEDLTPGVDAVLFHRLKEEEGLSM